MDDKKEVSEFSVFSEMPSGLDLTHIAVSLFRSVKSRDAKSIYSASCCIWTMTRIIDGLLARGYGGAPLTVNDIVNSLPPGPNPPTKISRDEEDYDDDEYEEDEEDGREDDEETISWLTARFRHRRQWPRVVLEASAAAYGIRQPLRLTAAAVNLPIIRTDAIIGKSGSYEVWVAKPGWPEEEQPTKRSLREEIQEWVTARFLEKRSWSADEIYMKAQEDGISEQSAWAISQELPIKKKKVISESGLYHWVWEAVPGWPE